MTFAYYNEFDPKAALWLWELIDMGMIAPGIVDERSIVDVDWRDLHGFTQCHFFAGIGGWSYALRLAGIPDNTPLWTASLPCQPFSIAGKKLGKSDERHLLPHFVSLVAQCSPSVIFGEQVRDAIKHGWLDDLYTEMEAHNYAVGSIIIGAHSVGAAHIRQRLYWVADSKITSRERAELRSNKKPYGGDIDERLVHPNEPRSQQRIETTEAARYGRSVKSAGRIERMADSISIECAEQGNGRGNKEITRSASGIDSHGSEYESLEWLYCRDGKYRPIESGLKPLAHGIPCGMVHSSDPRNTQEARAMRLKGYGNAIVPQVAAEFIKAFYESIL